MCHEDGSLPPTPPRAGAVEHAADLHLESADGTRFMAYAARPAEPIGAGAVILPDLRGLHEFYKSFARRLAEAGIAAVAIDYYGRNLPDGPRDAGPQEMMPLVMGLKPEDVAADVAAATAHLRAGEVGAVESVFSVGFCFGGSQSWLQSAFDHSLAGCVGFYGRPDDVRPFVDRMRVPLLILAGSNDALTPREDFGRFDAELDAAGLEHDMTIYEGAPHAFFDAAFAEFEEACADSWRRVLAFVDERAPQRSEA